MLIIANPLYDVVFKYLLEDIKVAKMFLSAIIGEEIEELDFSATERTTDIPVDKESKLDRNLTVCRFDFAAKIKTGEGYKVVAIELQKAKYADDIVRFRKYLAKHYDSDNNTYMEGDRKKARPIYAIYLLNYDIDLPDCPVITVDHVAKDAATGENVTADSEFIRGLNHKSWIVQMKQLKEHRRNKLERLLDVFAKGAEHDKEHTLNIPDGEVPEEYFALVRRLLNANADEKLRGAMELEDEILEELRARERKSAEKDKIIAAKDEENETLKKAMEAKDKENETLKIAMEEQAKIIAELENHLKKY